MNFAVTHAASAAHSLSQVEQRGRDNSALSGDEEFIRATASAAFLASPYASLILDWSGRVVLSNRRAERLFFPDEGDGTDKTMRGRSFSDYTQHDEAEFFNMLKAGAARGLVTFSMNDRRAARNPVSMALRVSLLRSPLGAERLYLLTQDQLKTTAEAITYMNDRRRKAQDSLLKLEAAHVELHETLVRMETFSRAASHDLRTPINTMSGMLELFEARFASTLPDDAREYLSVMLRAVDQMTRLTDDLLDHAISSSPEMSSEPLDLASFAQQVCTDHDHAFQEAGGSVSVIGDSFTVIAEPLLLHVLLSNLVSNAIKYRAAERPLNVVLELKSGLGRENRIVVRDNGIGFEQKQASAIFKPFHRLQPKIDGTGLGLSTCSEVCRRHGWSLDAKGTPNSGAAFTITFPAD